jgi:glucokinase
MSGGCLLLFKILSLAGCSDGYCTMADILTADIGATNSRFGHFRVHGRGDLELAQTAWLPTRNAASLGDLLRQLRARDFSLAPEQADLAVFAVAGPVEDGVYSAPPYIAWDIDVSRALEDFGLRRVLLINDFVAQAYACASPVMKSALPVVPGEVDKAAAKAVIGAGTALGQAALLPDGQGGYLPAPSEGGHASFPFESHKEFAYLDFHLKEVGGPYVTCNTVVSGLGLSLVHQFLTGEKLEPAELAACTHPESETVQWMARFYARACRNYALQVLARGGVYIAGGVAAKLPCLVTHEEFAREFHRSKTMARVLAKIPVFLNTDEESGLWGAAMRALQDLKSS